MAMIETECDFCSAVFKRRQDVIAASRKKGHGVFCSHDCYSRNKRGEQKPTKPKTITQDSLITLKCYICQKTFTRTPSDHALQLEKNPEARSFCSRECLDAREGETKIIECDYCYKLVEKPLHRIRGEHNFCDQECHYHFKRQLGDNETQIIQCKECKAPVAVAYGCFSTVCEDCQKPDTVESTCQICGATVVGHNTSRPRKYCDNCLPGVHKKQLRKVCVQGAHAAGERGRSKNEAYFAELCQKEYSNVACNTPFFGDPKGFLWDADVILHDLKIAVMWNGIYHLQKVFAKHNLELTKHRDARKVEAIKNAGYEPYIIEDRGKANKKFVEQQFELFKTHLKKRNDIK